MIFLDRDFQITIASFSGKRIDGIITNQPVELTESHIELIAESIMQVLYNLGLNSKIELNYDMKIKDGTSYFVNGSDVMVSPQTQDFYRRRIRNNPNIVRKD